MNNQENNIEIIEDKRTNKLWIWIIIVFLILIILGLVGYILYDKGIIFKQSESNTSEIDNSNEEKIQTQEDNKQKSSEINREQIMSKISILLNVKMNNIDSIWNVNTDVLSGNLSNKVKLRVALDSLDINDFTKKCKLDDNNDVTGVCDEDSKNCGESFIECETISATIVESRYLSLFGKKINLVTLKDDDVKCFDYIYDNNKNIYYVPGGHGCKVDPGTVYFYVNNITSENNYIYAYVSAGLTWEDEDGYYVYKAIYSKEDETTYYFSVDSNNKIRKASNVNDLFINQDNYQDFSEYKITFINDNGNYYFNSIDRTK